MICPYISVSGKEYPYVPLILFFIKFCQDLEHISTLII